MVRRNGERGMTIAFLALFIVILFVFAALAVDLGVFMTARTSAQHAADAAALAGALTFLSPGAIQPQAAQNAAIAVAAQNSVLGQVVTIAAGDISVDEANRRVTVTVARTGANGIQTFFARVIGQNSVNVQTQATAEAALQGSAARCIKPVFIPNTILSPSANLDTACNNGEVIFNANHQYSTWFLNNAANLYGTQMQIRPANPAQALAPSQFYSLDFGSGASTYSCSWGSCLNYCSGAQEVACGDPYPLETGNMVGPTKSGVADLIGDPPDTWADPNPNPTTGQYVFNIGGDTSNQSTNSRAVAVAPVWDNCTQSISPGYHGQTVTVIGFMDMFVTGFDNSTKNVLARFMNASECPSNGGGTGGSTGSGNPVTGPLGVPVRLVQNPT